MKRFILTATLAAVLVGCTTPKPTIPYANYQRIALGDVAANKCVSLGFMDYQIAAAAKNYAARDLNSWTYDPVFYQTTFAEISASAEKTPPTKAQCDSFSVAIVQRQQQEQRSYQQQQLAAQQQQALSQSLQTIQNSMPQTTYCNKVGWQTVCNTY